MRKLILKMSVSIDGFVGGPNGEVDWIFKSMDDGATAWVLDTLWQAGVHIMGSRTFYDMASYWPYTDELFAAPMNEIPKIFFTRKKAIESDKSAFTTQALKDAMRLKGEKDGKAALSEKKAGFSGENAAPMEKKAVEERSTDVNERESSWLQTPVLNGDLTEEINLLKQQPGKEILAHGGASFAQHLVEHRLIDEYRLLVHPVVLGRGLPLFSALAKPMDVKLVSTTLFPAGTSAHIYRPA